jgi:hypothetical protein
MTSSGLLCGVRWFGTDVSGLPIGFYIKVEQLDPGRWETGSPETSVSNQLTPHNIQED